MKSTEYTFKAGDKVTIIDEESKKPVKGVILDVMPDCLLIKWEDFSESVQHGTEEYHLIKVTL